MEEGEECTGCRFLGHCEGFGGLFGEAVDAVG